MTSAMTHKQRVLTYCRPEMDIMFTCEEYRERLNRVRAAMEAAGVDLLYLSSPEAICYLSGFKAEWYQAQGPKSWYPASGLAVRLDADDYLHFETENEQVLAAFTSVSKNFRIFGESSQPTDSMMTFILSALKDEGWLKGTVGLEMWSYRPARGYSELFQKALETHGCKVVDATDIVAQIRKIKSPQELVFTRTAARIGDIGMQAAIDTIAPGVSELEVYGEMVRAMAKAGGENASITMPVSAGPKSACMHALASRRLIAPGNVVNIDLCGVYNRYHSNMARTVCVGEPHPEVDRYLDAITGVKSIVSDLIRPNLPVAQLLSTIEAYYREQGIWEDQCWIGGYDLGQSFPPDWVGPYFYDVHTDPREAVFEPGMVTNYEANFYLPRCAGMSMFIDTMIFTDDEAQFLQHTPAKPAVV